jgi:hypothetical protein
MVGQPVEQIGEIGFGLEIIELCCLCRLPNYAEWARFLQRFSWFSRCRIGID